MRLLLLFVSVLLCGHALAATSDIFVYQDSLSFGKRAAVQGSPGNVIFNGDNFATSTVQTNGEIYFTVLGTNGYPISHSSVAATGSSSRLAFDGTNYVIAWLNTNVAPALLVCSRLTNGVVSSISTLATNAVPETIFLRASAESFLAVWQSSESNSAVFARSIGSDGLPAANAFAISPSAAPQRYPALNMESTNSLVCWMEQNLGSNDWRVMARRINATGALGPAITVSQTNSLTPHPTACAFGTNFLVAWSVDEGPYAARDYGHSEDTNLWFAMVYGRMLTPEGTPVGNTLPIIRAAGANTNVVLAFGGGQYWAETFNGSHPWFRFRPFGVQLLKTDGTRVQGGFHSWWGFYAPPRLGFGSGRFCVLYPWSAGAAGVELFGRETIEEPMLGIRRIATNGTFFFVEAVRGNDAPLEVSTNLIDWRLYYRWTELPSSPQVFFRAANNKWPCIENLRAIHGAKQQWALDHKRGSLTSLPMKIFLDLAAIFGKSLSAHLVGPTGSVRWRPTRYARSWATLCVELARESSSCGFAPPSPRLTRE